MSAHTPGPWKAGNVENRTGGRSAVLIWAEGGDDLGEARTFADARLMAAAPRMKTALDALVVNYAQFGRVTDHFVRDVAALLQEIEA